MSYIHYDTRAAEAKQAKAMRALVQAPARRTLLAIVVAFVVGR